MLFATAFTEWFPIVLLVLTSTALVVLVVRFVKLYVDMRREKKERIAASRKPDATLSVDGDYLVMTALCLYGVGGGKQLAAGNYLIKTQEGETVSLQINGVVVDYRDGESICLKEGDALRAEKDVGLKPEEVR